MSPRACDPFVSIANPFGQGARTSSLSPRGIARALELHLRTSLSTYRIPFLFFARTLPLDRAEPRSPRQHGCHLTPGSSALGVERICRCCGVSARSRSRKSDRQHSIQQEVLAAPSSGLCQNTADSAVRRCRPGVAVPAMQLLNNCNRRGLHRDTCLQKTSEGGSEVGKEQRPSAGR